MGKYLVTFSNGSKEVIHATGMEGDEDLAAHGLAEFLKTEVVKIEQVD